MKLLIINDGGIFGGGTENRIRLLINEFLARKSFSAIHILQLRQEQTPHYPENVFCHISKGVGSTFRLSKEIIKNEGIDIVQLHNVSETTPLSILSARSFHKPVIWFAHDYWPICAYRSFINPYLARSTKLCQEVKFLRCRKCAGLKATLKLKFFQYLMEKVNIAISPSQYVTDTYESYGLLKGKWRVITPWIALDKFEKNQQFRMNLQIFFVGSLVEYKGAWVAAESLKFIKEVYPKIKMKFIGDNQKKGNIFRERIEEIGKRDSTLENMSFIGYCSWEELRSEFSRGGIFVFPSVCKETFGLSWAEAMAFGLPVVASRIGSLPEFIEDKAILVEPGNPKELAQAAIKLFSCDSFAASLAQKGQKYAVESFAVSRAAEELFQIYKRLLT